MTTRVAKLTGLVLLTAAIILSLILFRQSQLGWFGETVTDVPAWQAQWQEWIKRQPLEHPAMVHWVPPDCLCRFFTAGHATTLSERADNLGYSVYQIGEPSLSLDVARPITSSPDFPTPGPLVLLTNAEGGIRYLGPYSDGLTCTQANSLVDDWLPLTRPGQLLNLDVTSCRCLYPAS